MNENKKIVHLLEQMNDKLDRLIALKSPLIESSDIKKKHLENEATSYLQRCQEILLFFLARKLLSPGDPRYRFLSVAAFRGVEEWCQSLGYDASEKQMRSYIKEEMRGY